MAKDKMRVKFVPIDSVIPYDRNPRKNEDAVEYVANSIREFGWQQPIVVDSENVVIAGHTRLLAAKSLGMESVPVIVADELSPEQVKAYRLADNKVAEMSSWDKLKLNFELGELQGFNMELFGFFDDEKEDEVEAEVPFTEELREEHNYVVLYFDNDIDWLQAQTLFDIKPVAALSTRKDGKIGSKSRRVGVGRVLNGAKAMERLRNEYQR